MDVCPGREGAVKTPVRLRHRHKHSQFKKSKTASPQPFQALDLGIDTLISSVKDLT